MTTKSDCARCGQPYDSGHDWGFYGQGHCLKATYTPKVERKPDAKPGPLCPTCHSDKVVEDSDNGVGNTHSCQVCYTDFTPGKKKERPYSLFDKNG